MIKLSVAEFKWSANEQVYPFEKSSAGEVLYCKEVYTSSLPNNGAQDIAHGITITSTFKVHALTVFSKRKPWGFNPCG